MKLTYTLTLDDYKAALLLHRRQKLIRRINVFIWPILTFAFLIGVIVFTGSGHQELLTQCLIFGVVSLWLAIALPIARYFNMRKGFNRILLSKQMDRRISIDIDDERIVSEIPGVGEGKYFWNAIIAFAQDKKVTLLSLYKDRFLLFPTAMLSEDQHAELNDLVARHVSKRKP